MAITIDPRPTVFGDRMVITGSYEAGDTTINLSSQLSSIDFAGTNSAAISVSLPEAGNSAAEIVLNMNNQIAVSGTTITILDPLQTGGGGTAAGTFIAIGRRS
tara:strand:+ start:390 stop:698 length:309 start_codon:yes stop_codon:yes gene_type:complete